MKKILLYMLVAFLTINTTYATTHKHKKRHKQNTTYAITHKHKKQSYTTSKVASITLTMLNNEIKGLDSSAPSVAISKIDMQSIANQPRLYSYSALAVDAKTGEILISKNPHTKLPIASISKLMTAIVLLDSEANLDEYITISSDDIDTLKNTSSRLQVGMKLRRRDLLLLALMSSENRAAFSLGRTAYPGGIKVFIKKMNEKALSLGMTHTQFYDPTGLTNSNQSTAEDLAKMVQAAFGYDLIRAYSTMKGANVQLGKNYIHHYMNSDALVRGNKLHIALSKTGFINEAGHCLVLYSLVGKQPIIMVFLNSSGKSGRLLDAIAVKNYVQN